MFTKPKAKIEELDSITDDEFNRVMMAAYVLYGEDIDEKHLMPRHIAKMKRFVLGFRNWSAQQLADIDQAFNNYHKWRGFDPADLPKGDG